jgi:short-subunit dehydrogenase
MPEINKEHRNQYALITGATSGIGYELAKLFAKDGYSLILVARSEDMLQKVTNEFKELGVEVTPMVMDLFRPGAAYDVYEKVKQMGIHVDVLVNDAGQGQHGMFVDVPLERHLEIIQLNVVALVSLTKHFLDDMKKRGEGKILQLASVVSKTPAPEFAIYAASKAFVLSFSEALSRELKDTNITVTALMPGRTDTDFFYKAELENSEEYQEHKLADPVKVAKDGYDALMSGESRIISGAENKMMIGMMNAMPDGASAAFMQKNMQPSDKAGDERKTHSEHPASQEERNSIQKKDGDRQEANSNK